MPSDKFHDECGVVAIFANPEAEKLAYLGLHALQHRGQESAGIVSSDGLNLNQHKAMGLVADIFTEDVLAKLRGSLAIGHTRYSTAGDSALLNAQPIRVQSNKGAIALAHNGNLVNANQLRQRLVVHVGLISDAAGHLAVDFPLLELIERGLGHVQFDVFVLVLESRTDVVNSIDQELIENLTLSRLKT